MRAGQLDKRIRIEAPSPALDDAGQPVLAWDLVHAVSANIRPIGGREKMQAGAMGAALTHTVCIRWQNLSSAPAGVSAWRIVYGSRVFQILSMRDVDEAHKFIIFDCTEGGSNGN